MTLANEDGSNSPAREKIEKKMEKIRSQITSNYKAFGVNKDGLPPQLMVTFRILDGTAMAFPYGYLVNLFFDDQKRVILSFVSHTVTVEGEHLTELFSGLENWGIGFVQELEPKDKKDGEPFVSTITIEARQQGEDEEGSELPA
jgi:hypothetical protein